MSSIFSGGCNEFTLILVLFILLVIVAAAN